MKTRKIFVAVCMIFAAVFTASADNDKVITAEQLPANSRQFLQTYFKGVAVTYAKIDQDIIEKTYEVMLANGAKIEFDKKGNWDNVDCEKSALPEGLVPAQIKDFVTKNHPGQTIVKIDREKSGYDIELRNDLEIKFDKKYNAVGYDD